MSNQIKESFEKIMMQIVRNPETWFVCLMEYRPFYGGPEEGGWWGEDVELISYAPFRNEELAIDAAKQVWELAARLTRESKTQFNEMCARSLDDAEARGIDPSSLPEVADGSRYAIIVTRELPQEFEEGNRRYE